MRDLRAYTALCWALGAGAAWVLTACGGSHPPAGTGKKPSTVDWDGSRLVETANGPMALAGPVLRSPRQVQTASIGVSERCWLIALGVPHLETPFDETVRGLVRGDGPFDVGWETEDRGATGACTDAFGYGFRLPTITEAQSAFEMRTLSTRTATSVLARDDASEITTVRFEPRSVEGCGVRDQGCDVHVEFETGREGPGLLYCVGPASRLPAPVPGDLEIRQCVRRVNAEVERLDPSKRERVTLEDELDFLFAMRRACGTQKAAEFTEIARRLHAAGDGVPLNQRIADRKRALANATSAHAQAVAATRENTDTIPMNCADPRVGYEKICLAESCLAAQVRYAARCRGIDPRETIERLERQLAARTAELTKEVRRLELESKVGAKVSRCAKDPATALVFRALLGDRPAARVSQPPCVCPIHDLDCGISRLLDPERCPSSASDARGAACGCAENDLSCAMKCAE